MNFGTNKQYMSMLFAAMGSHLLGLMKAEDVMEIFVNEDGVIWADRIGKPIEPTGEVLSAEQAKILIGLVASSVAMEATTDTPRVFAEFPGFNARFQAQLPPIVDAPVFTIRKHQSVLISLDDYIASGGLTYRAKAELVTALTLRKGILVAGPTSSGKTTFANALLLEISRIAEHDRIVIIEDTKELQCQSRNKLRLRSVPNVADMHDLLRDSLRHSPKRIVVGEVRGIEAFALINAWMVGHKGIATLHANSCAEALTRLETLLTMAGVHAFFERWICTALDLIVYIERTMEGWKVTDIQSVDFDIEAKGYQLKRLIQ